jgi:hypothetical protein
MWEGPVTYSSRPSHTVAGWPLRLPGWPLDHAREPGFSPDKSLSMVGACRSASRSKLRGEGQTAGGMDEGRAERLYLWSLPGTAPDPPLRLAVESLPPTMGR